MTREAIAGVLQADARIAYALVFGSASRGTAYAGSDVDIGVGLVPGARLDPLDLGALVSRLETATGEDVDLVILDEAPPGIAYRAFRDGMVVLERDRSRLVESKARAIVEYLDFEPVERALAEGALRAAARGR